MNICRHIKEQVAALERSPEVEIHLQSCSNCQSFADDIACLKQQITTLSIPSFLNVVSSETNVSKIPKIPLARWTPKLTLGVVAMLLLIAGFVSLLILRSPAPKTPLPTQVSVTAEATGDSLSILAFLEGSFSHGWEASVDNESKIWVWQPERYSLEGFYLENLMGQALDDGWDE